MVTWKIDSSSIKTCFFKNVRNVLWSDILVHSMLLIQRNANRQEPHHAITYLGKVKGFLTCFHANTVEFIRVFLKVIVKNSTYMCLLHLLWCSFMHPVWALFLFSIWFSILEMSGPGLSLLSLAAFAENLQDNISCTQTLWYTFLIILKDWQKGMKR